jgi:hypothetical protein
MKKDFFKPYGHWAVFLHGLAHSGLPARDNSGWARPGQRPTATGLAHGAWPQRSQSVRSCGSAARCIDSTAEVAWPTASAQCKTGEHVSTESFYELSRVRPARNGTPDRTEQGWWWKGVELTVHGGGTATTTDGEVLASSSGVLHERDRRFWGLLLGAAVRHNVHKEDGKWWAALSMADRGGQNRGHATATLPETGDDGERADMW